MRNQQLSSEPNGPHITSPTDIGHNTCNGVPLIPRLGLALLVVGSIACTSSQNLGTRPGCDAGGDCATDGGTDASRACGPITCGEGQQCCNAECGVCAAADRACPEVSCGEPCGEFSCTAGQQCCSAECGVCAAAGQACPAITCPVTDAGVDSGPPDTGAPDTGVPGGDIVPANACTDPIPTLVQAFYEVQTDGLTNDLAYDELDSRCTPEQSSGQDGVDATFQFEAAAGQRWHFHAQPGSVDQDISLSVLSSCGDPRECETGKDQCPGGSAEHVTFEPTTGGTYFLVIDNVGPDAPLTVLTPICGNGIKEHGEVCDDENIENFDRCDSKCRLELIAAREEEAEPNDEVLAANVLLPPGGTQTILGNLGGFCDFDYFLIDVLAGQDLSVEMRTALGTVCTSGDPHLDAELRLFDLDGNFIGGPRQLGDFPSGVDGGVSDGCREIDPSRHPGAASLPAGRYLLLAHDPTGQRGNDYDYELVVTLSD